MAFESRSLAFGAYWVTFSGSFVGLTEGPLQHEVTYSAEPVRASIGGDTVLDEVYTGVNMFCTIIFKEWSAATKAAFNPFSGTEGATGVIGRSKWDMASILLLTAVAGTPAATVGPATRTYAKAIVATDASVLQEFVAGERNVPVTFRILPEATDDSTVQAGSFTHYVDA